MLDTEGAQGEFDIDHAKTFAPKPKPEIAEAGDKEFEIIPVPETKDQTPVPTAGAFAVIVAVGTLKQIVWFAPAIEEVGRSFTSIATVDVELAQGELEMVQAKTFVPKPKPVIDVVAESELVITPVPETSDHDPKPIKGTFAFINVDGEEMHSV